MKKEKFIIFHTARHVDYNIKGFRTKNMDEVRKEL
jgi:myosin heavy subunit